MYYDKSLNFKKNRCIELVRFKRFVYYLNWSFFLKFRSFCFFAEILKK